MHVQVWDMQHLHRGHECNTCNVMCRVERYFKVSAENNVMQMLGSPFLMSALGMIVPFLGGGGGGSECQAKYCTGKSGSKVVDDVARPAVGITEIEPTPVGILPLGIMPLAASEKAPPVGILPSEATPPVGILPLASI